MSNEPTVKNPDIELAAAMYMYVEAEQTYNRVLVMQRLLNEVNTVRRDGTEQAFMTTLQERINALTLQLSKFYVDNPPKS